MADDKLMTYFNLPENEDILQFYNGLIERKQLGQIKEEILALQQNVKIPFVSQSDLKQLSPQLDYFEKGMRLMEDLGNRLIDNPASLSAEEQKKQDFFRKRYVIMQVVDKKIRLSLEKVKNELEQAKQAAAAFLTMKEARKATKKGFQSVMKRTNKRM